MASAKAGVHVVQLKPITVPKLLQDGYKFIKWDDDSTNGTPVTLRVDANGFFLYWTDQNKDTEFLDISSIRDTRTGKSARTPREGKLRETVNMGADLPLEDKTLTVAYGTDFVNINFINFCCNCKDVAQDWADLVLKIAYNLLALNGSAYMFMIKAHTKILLMKDREGKIPVKNIVKMFAQHKDDRRRVEKALEETSLPYGKNDSLNPEALTLDKFLRFTKHLVARSEVDAIFDSFCCALSRKNRLMTVAELVKFLNLEQRDPRLNEILHPYANRTRGCEIISMYEPTKENQTKAVLSVEGFLRYLMSDDNAVVAPEKFDLNQDLDQPLNHYFINSSHNTYLTGHQLTGKSSVEIYRQVLLAGCRCIELDCWNGRNSDEEPIITHGYTVVTDIVLKEVLEAIAETAFKTSDFPVILSFENHCSAKQQAKIAHYCRKIFGDMLLTEVLANIPLKPGVPLPSPNQLAGKIIIKNKKQHHGRSERTVGAPGNPGTSATGQPGQAETSSDLLSTSGGGSTMLSSPERRAIFVGRNSDESGLGFKRTIEREDSSQLNDSDECPSASRDLKTAGPSGIPMGASSCDIEDIDSDSSGDDDDTMAVTETMSLTVELMCEGGEVSAAVTAHIKESEAGAEMSALVLYIQPVRFHSFEHAEKRQRSYEISSFVETQATALLKSAPVDFVNFNKFQFSRVYPRGTRVDSSNYMPQLFWNAGCQMVALNFQTLDLGMQLNLGVFEYNGRSGYLLKPDFMRRHDRRFDPFTESTVDGIIAGTVAVKIISGQFLSDKRIGTYVEVDMFGLPADTVRRKRTKTIPNNGLNPVYGDELFLFKKVVLPDLACIRIAAYEESGKLIGHRILPTVGLRPGYRHISLRNESSQPLLLPTIFVHITVKDYVPDGLSELADALANPIAYQSIADKRANQLQALTDDTEVERAHLAQLHDSLPHRESTTKVTVSAETPVKRDPASSSHEHRNCNSSSPGNTLATSPSGGNAGRESRSNRNEPSNVGLQRPPSSSCSSSPAHPSSSVPPLLRQDTFSMRMNQSVRSLSDDTGGEKTPSLLESSEAQIRAESLDELREVKAVRKILSKMEKELQSLRKKQEKIREKEISVIQQKEDKIIHAQAKQKSAMAKTNSKIARKSASTSEASGTNVSLAAAAAASAVSTAPTTSIASTAPASKPRTRRQSLQFLVSSVPSLHRTLLKQRSELDLQKALQDQQTKLDDLYKNSAPSMLAIIKDQVKGEILLYEKYHDQVYAALEKVMQASQAAQNASLQSLHDQEVSTLMKRLEGQNKEDLTSLSKKHKDKNELARIKRELQQRLIDQAVTERQRFNVLLDKRKTELEARHEEVRLKLEGEKAKALEIKRRQQNDKLEKLQKEFDMNPVAFVVRLTQSSSPPIVESASTSSYGSRLPNATVLG